MYVDVVEISSSEYLEIMYYEVWFVEDLASSDTTPPIQNSPTTHNHPDPIRRNLGQVLKIYLRIRNHKYLLWARSATHATRALFLSAILPQEFCALLVPNVAVIWAM